MRLAEILRAGAWHDLEIEWDVDTGGCRLRVDGADTGVLRAQRRATAGASYLRLRLPAAEGPAATGLRIERVEAVILP